MSYRPLPDPNEILDIEVETPDMVETARLIECGERQLRMLARMAEVGIGLVDMLEQIAKTKHEAASPEGADPRPVDDIAGAYGKITQSLRRTLAMEARLAEEMKARRLGVFATRNTRRQETALVVREGVDESIEYALTKAIRRERPDTDREAAEGLLVDMFERLGEVDEFDDYHLRPPGETVAKLCAAFGLDPEFCIQADDETWMIRHGAGEPDDPLPPSACGEGQDAKHPEWGAAGKPDAFQAAEPHSDRSAICPSP